jgi:hypothetical protein
VKRGSTIFLEAIQPGKMPLIACSIVDEDNHVKAFSEDHPCEIDFKVEASGNYRTLVKNTGDIEICYNVTATVQ